MDTLTTELAEEYLRRAIIDYGPDHVDDNAANDEPCQNVYRDGGGQVTGRCIAAQVLAHHGVTDHQLESYNNASIGYVLDVLEIPCDGVAKQLLAEAQGLQDEASPWQEVVDKAVEFHLSPQ